MASEGKFVLKPCPCCGGAATMEHGAERSDNGWVVCMECGLSTRYHDDPAEAAAEWNRRACDAHHETPSTVHNGDCVQQTERNAAGEKPEVADAVIAEMRDEAARADTEQYYTLDDAAESMREYANRLEAALKRERAAFDCECAGIAELAAKEEAARHKPGNAAALREAVVALLDSLDSLGCDESTAALAAFVPDMADSSARCLAAFRKAKAAISAPARQCDVGTAEEQIERLYGGETCPSCKSPQMTSDGCACVREGPCALRWAQTPYEEEGAGE